MEKESGMHRVLGVALLLGVLVSLSSIPVVLAATVQGTAITRGGLDGLAATVTTQARKGAGKVVAVLGGMGGLGGMLAGRIGLGLSGVGAGMGLGCVPGIMRTACEAAPAAPRELVTPRGLVAAWGAPRTAGRSPGVVRLRLVHDPVGRCALDGAPLPSPVMAAG
jgi:hypothetical protein